jgi:hypothetical protein
MKVPSKHINMMHGAHPTVDQACQAYTAATGCEVVWDLGNRGCYIHTKEIAKGNSVARPTPPGIPSPTLLTGLPTASDRARSSQALLLDFLKVLQPCQGTCHKGWRLVWRAHSKHMPVMPPGPWFRLVQR